MSCKADHRTPLNIALSPVEGAQLEDCLSHVISQHQSAPMDALQLLESRLAEANAVAIWLRENVSLECSRTELPTIHQVLTAELSKKRLPANCLDALSRFLDRLSEACRAATGQPDARLA